MKKLLVLVIIVLAVIGGWFTNAKYQKQQQVKAINSFEDCTAAGFPVMESYPAQCRTSDGRTFTQNINNDQNQDEDQNQDQQDPDEDLSNLIVVDTPQPNQKITSPLRIGGKARGPWYFEANFSVELLDGNNKSLGIGIAQAQGEWMTEDFVPFEGKILFDKPATANGKLVIKNANPSGLPDNEKELVMPVLFE